MIFPCFTRVQFVHRISASQTAELSCCPLTLTGTALEPVGEPHPRRSLRECSHASAAAGTLALCWRLHHSEHPHYCALDSRRCYARVGVLHLVCAHSSARALDPQGRQVNHMSFGMCASTSILHALFSGDSTWCTHLHCGGASSILVVTLPEVLALFCWIYSETGW